ncbi:MAG: hypothetical protein BM485_01780 [Desulfobulbaceae bacterium DB1]|nr:MAG: hypothetical protein BM485_01780 [Desulfobulbaceae bacterium DB1]
MVIFFLSMSAIGGMFGWIFAMLVSGLAAANWQVSEMIRHFFSTMGYLREYENLREILVVFYSHIREHEYLIVAVAFVAVLPIYSKYLNSKEVPAAEE